MIYIVSGASRSGKSIVARRFSQRKLIPYLPLDSIMMGFMNGVPSMGIHDKLWPHEIADKIWPFLAAMCDNMLQNQIDFLFEGEAVLPARIKAFSDCHPGQLKICFIGFADMVAARKVADVKRYPNHEGDWLVSQTEDCIVQHIENMITYSLRIKEECQRYGLAYFDTSADFEHAIEEVLLFLEGDLSEKHC